MPRPKKHKLTAVERLIILSIVAILISIIMPNLQRAKRYPHRLPRSAPVLSQRPAEPGGQLNTIEVSEKTPGRGPVHPETRGRALGAIVRLAAAVAVTIVAVNAVRRWRKRAEQ